MELNHDQQLETQPDFSQLKDLALGPINGYDSDSLTSCLCHKPAYSDDNPHSREGDSDVYSASSRALHTSPPTSITKPTSSGEVRTPGHASLQAPKEHLRKIAMTVDGTQASDRTDVQSQWVYKEISQELHNSTIGHRPEHHSVERHDALQSGDNGYVEFNPEQYADLGKGDTLPQTQASDEAVALEEEEDALSVVSESMTQIDRFPENERFHPPKTPAVQRSDRKREGVADATPETPLLPANPFGHAIVPSSAPMGLTQAFKNTQAPSSSSAEAMPSSERPSPNFAHLQRLSAAEVSSSPAKLQSSSSKRAMPRQHLNWRTSPRALSSNSSPLAADGSVDVFDELLLEDEKQRQFRRRAEASRQKAQRELSRVTAGSSSDTSLGKRKRPGSRTVSSSPPPPVLRGTMRRSDAGSESEAETELEVTISHSDADDDKADAVGDEDKENVATESTEIAPRGQKYSRAPLGKIISPHSERKIERVREEDQPTKVPNIDLRLQCQQRDIEYDPPQQLGTTIADSQPLRQEETSSDTCVVPESTSKSHEDSSNIVRESQSAREPNSSGTSKPRPRKPPPMSSTHPTPSPSADTDPRAHNNLSINKDRKTTQHVFSDAHSNHFVDPGRFSSSEGDNRGPVPAFLDITRTPQHAAPYMTIPETESAHRHPEKRMIQIPSSQTPVAFKRPGVLRRHSMPPQASTNDLAAQQTASTDVAQYASQHSSHSQQRHSQQSQPPKALMEITNAHLTDVDSQKVDMDFEMLNEDVRAFVQDPEEHSSPISSLRKRKLRTRKQSQNVPAPESSQHTFSVPTTQNFPEPTRELSSPAAQPESNTAKRTNNLRGDVHKPSLDGVPGVVSDNAHEQFSSSPLSSVDSEVNKEPPSSIVEQQVQTGFETKRTLFPRVFAYWPGQGLNFYPATCLEERATEPKFKVRFDYDGIVTDVKSTQIKRLELAKGDHLRVDVDKLRTKVYVVESCFETVSEDEEWPQTDVYGNRKIKARVKSKNEKSDEVVEFLITSVYHGGQTWKLFKDRDVSFWADNSSAVSDYTAHVPNVSISLPYTPPKRKSRADQSGPLPPIVKTMPNLSRGLFTRMRFVTTNLQDDENKDAALTIDRNGGQLLKDGFGELFVQAYDATATPTSASKRGLSRSTSTTAERSTSLLSNQPLQLESSIADNLTVLLLAPDYCRNTKYFQALALGIPCISIRWLYLSLEKGVLLPWHHFVLAAGKSTLLYGATISRSLPISGNPSAWSLRDMIASRTTWLSDCHVLFVGVARENSEAYLFLARALGAREVSEVRDEEAARQALQNSSGSNMNTFVVLNEASVLDSGTTAIPDDKPAKRRKASAKDSMRSMPGHLELASEFEGVRVVSTEFVMQCLILGRLVD